MSPRVLTAAAIAAALAGPAGRAAAQFPPDAAPVSPAGGLPDGPGGAPYTPGPVPPGYPPGGFPGGPGGGPYTPGPMSPGYPPGGFPGGPPGAMPGGPAPSGGPELPTDALGAPAARGPKFWVGAEYLAFWTKKAPLSIPIATIGPATGTGAIGSRGAQVVLGGSDFDYKNFSGLRLSAGYWLTNNESLGLEGNMFFLPQKTAGTPPIYGTNLFPTLARPFLDTSTGLQSSRVLNQPGFFSGGIKTDATETVWGAEFGPVWRMYDNGGHFTLDALTGFKFLSLEESLTVSDFATAQAGGVAVFQGLGNPSPATTYVTDRVATQNHFYGGMLGSRMNFHYEAVTLSLTGKIGLGMMRESGHADGTTTLNTGTNPPVTSPGGFFAVAGNSGQFSQNKFVVIPELGTNANVQVTSHLALTFGYTFMYVSSVVRPGDQLNNMINPTLVPTSQNFGTKFGPSQQPIPMATASFWAQGINIGMTIGY